MKSEMIRKFVTFFTSLMLIASLTPATPVLAWTVLNPAPFIVFVHPEGEEYYGREQTSTNNGIEGNPYSQDPVMENGRMLVPLRQFAEELGYSVTWNNEDSSITMSGGKNSIWMQIDNPSAIKNGVPVELEAPPRLVNNLTMMPLRFVAEAAGYSIDTFHSPNIFFISYYAYLSGEEMDALSDLSNHGDEDIYRTPSGIEIGSSVAEVINTYGTPNDYKKKDNKPYPQDYTGKFWYSDFEAWQCGSYGLVLEITDGVVSRMYMSH